MKYKPFGYIETGDIEPFGDIEIEKINFTILRLIYF